MSEYAGVNADDPIRFYQWPLVGRAYQRRIELCLAQLTGGERILEVGFGSGVTFLNLSQMYNEIHGLDLTASIDEVTARFRGRGIQTRLKSGSVLNMPYDDNCFDSVLLISILEHLKPQELGPAFSEIRRVLKPGGQVVYGVPVERFLMVAIFRVMGFDIREHHFSTEVQVREAANDALNRIDVVSMKGPLGLLGEFYEVGHFSKPLE